MRARALLMALALTACGPGCLWAPSIASSGYTSCDASRACAPGRSCELGLCAPPPWHDEGFAARQLFIVENPSDEPLRAGAAVPLRVGAGGLIAGGELGVDGRFASFDDDAKAWRVLPVFRDVYDDHLIAWLPVAREVPAGGGAELAWLETQTAEGAPTLLEDPGAVFLFFDDFEGADLSDERYDHFGTGRPTVAGGRVNVADNQRLVSRLGFAPPLSVTWRGRINGVTCSRFFIGLVAGAGAGYEPPSAGFFSNEALEIFPEVAPNADSVPRPVGEAVQVSTAEHRYRIDVGAGGVRFFVDDVEVIELEPRPAFEADALHLRVEVDDGCSLDVSRVLVSPLPFRTPKIQVESRVEFQVFD